MIIIHFNKTTWSSVRALTGLAKLSAFLYRIYFRHPKLILASYLTGLVIPAWIICETKSPRTQGQS